MRRTSRIFIPTAFLILLFLAVWPHLPTIRGELSHLYKTWQQIRKDPPILEAPIATPPPTEPFRQRQLSSPTEPAPATTQAEDEDDPVLTEARRLAQKDPETAMRWLQEQHAGPDRLRGMLEVVAIWAAKDSESALLWLESNAQGIARLETLNSGIELWAGRDPAAAALWIDGMANDGSKVSAAKSLAATWAKTNPQRAAVWINSLQTGPLRQEAARALAVSWVEKEPKAAAEWALIETQFHANKALISDTIQTYTQQSPDEAEAFLRASADAYDIDAALSSHLSARAKENPAAAADWLLNLSKEDPLYTPEHARNIVFTWTETDSIAASAWLSEQPAGPERDAAIAGFSESIRPFEPEAAAEWASTITNPDRRTEELTISLQSWAQSQPEAALNWLINAELDPGLEEELARKIGFD